MLQLATIISMVKPWKTCATLRVFLCIDATNEDVRQVEKNLEDFLSQLRINAQTRVISWTNVVRLLDHDRNVNMNNINEGETTSMTTPSQKSPRTFVDVNDAYIRGVNELLREQCDKTSCLYLYLPRPPDDKRHSQRYIHVLDMLSTDLPPIMFVHGVSFVTCTHL